MKVSIISSSNTWIEGLAAEQLQKTAQLPGIVRAVGMPDLHPGKDAPIGAAFASCDTIYPHLVDRDIGCGIGLWQLDLQVRKTSADRIEKRLQQDLEGPWQGPLEETLEASGMARSTDFDASSMGTIGHGNHFAEISRLHKIIDHEKSAQIGLRKEALYLLVHSGSRGLGESIFEAHARRHGKSGLKADSIEAIDYISAHDHALKWAFVNRKIIAERFMNALNTTGKPIADVSHNHVRKETIGAESLWIHRKGAASTSDGLILIAGSRGTLSYLVEASGDQTANLASAAHGAGRKWKRSECRARIERIQTKSGLLKT
ncbi:MAG TPA: RNA ligase RtcB family protein, partial [Chroococcales cyanobacterium]